MPQVVNPQAQAPTQTIDEGPIVSPAVLQQSIPASAIPQAGDRAAMNKAKRQLELLRKSIRRFQQARTITDEAISGLRKSKKYSPHQIREIVDQMRDKKAEKTAVVNLKKLIGLVLNPSAQNPNPATGQQYKQGIPPESALEGLGWFWAPLIAVAALTGGAASLTGYFDYLTEQERRIQDQTRINRYSWSDVFGSVANSAWLTPVLALTGVTALGVGGYFLWKYVIRRDIGLVEEDIESVRGVVRRQRKSGRTKNNPIRRKRRKTAKKNPTKSPKRKKSPATKDAKFAKTTKRKLRRKRSDQGEFTKSLIPKRKRKPRKKKADVEEVIVEEIEFEDIPEELTEELAEDLPDGTEDGIDDLTDGE